MTEDDRITEQIALEDKMDHIYTVCFIRIDSRPDEIYYYQKMEDARYHFKIIVFQFFHLIVFISFW